METRFSITVALVCRQIRTHWKLCIMYKVKKHTATKATTVPTGRITGERKQHHNNMYLNDTLVYNSMRKDPTTLSHIDLRREEEPCAVGHLLHSRANAENCEGWWLSCCCSSVTTQARYPGWVPLPANADLAQDSG